MPIPDMAGEAVERGAAALVVERPLELGVPQLIVGSALFGTGWGIAGYCPGPALASLGGGAPSLLVLVATLVAGWWLAAKIPAARA